jgi:lysozyme
MQRSFITVKKYRLLLSIVLFVPLLCYFSQFTYAMGPSSKKIYKGIDVSEWQGNINYAKVAASNVKVIYIKASEGSHYKDSKFERNYAMAKANGLKVGFYHYVTARTTAEAVQQAKFFVSVIGGKKTDCKLAMDFERFGNLSISQINKIALAFIQTVEKVSGEKGIVYSNWYDTHAVFNVGLSLYPLWIAEYGISSPKNSKNWSVWVGFQYSDIGRISGITGNVDSDKYTDGVFLGNPNTIKKISSPTCLCPNENITNYKVKSGDTLLKIASRFHTTVSCIRSLNKINNNNLIHIGEILKIYTIAQPCQKSTNYTIMSGDTLYGIARKFHTTITELATRNHIKNPSLIYAGQVISLP